ncbi:MAG: hypothetical protein LBL84_00525 [Candidatus Nomurabacteria bacterium]|nr:hypothetical protein [Candidatus Nomurabacteria bacterium]
MADKAPEITKDTKQEVASKIKDSESILITVNNDPTVDELATALALTLVIDSMGKHATAIASGKIPDALEFLSPEKTFENNVDSLRDFIIALNKEKADHLRYKIEGDFVKVFITPYRTTISEDDLEFSRGDYNVELVISLNVKTNDNLDKALRAHGKILHDATVINITTSSHEGIGDVSWVDENSSSLAEMVENLISYLKPDEEGDSLIDQAVATALLTGIVSATDRFSNERTSATTMGAASKLMKYGADQQLVVSNLDKFKHAFDDDLAEEATPKKSHHKSGKKAKPSANELAIDHGDGDESEGESESASAEPAQPEQPSQPEQQPVQESITSMSPSIDPAIERGEEAAKLVEERLATGLANVGAGATGPSALDDLKNETDKITQSEAAPEVPAAPDTPSAPDYSSVAEGEPQGTEPPVLQGAVANWQRHILPMDSGAPVGAMPGTVTGDQEEPSVPSIEDAAVMPSQTSAVDSGAAPEGPAMFGSALTPGQLPSLPGTEPVATPEPPTPEPIPVPEPASPAPIDMSSSPFVPPVPPPPIPDFSATSGLPLPPDATPIAEPQPPESVLPSEPVLPESAPADGVFENNTPVMQDQVYPQAAQSTDIGAYRIPGT